MIVELSDSGNPSFFKNTIVDTEKIFSLRMYDESMGWVRGLIINGIEHEYNPDNYKLVFTDFDYIKEAMLCKK